MLRFGLAFYLVAFRKSSRGEILSVMELGDHAKALKLLMIQANNLMFFNTCRIIGL